MIGGCFFEAGCCASYEICYKCIVKPLSLKFFTITPSFLIGSNSRIKAAASSMATKRYIDP